MSEIQLENLAQKAKEEADVLPYHAKHLTANEIRGRAKALVQKQIKHLTEEPKGTSDEYLRKNPNAKRAVDVVESSLQ